MSGQQTWLDAILLRRRLLFDLGTSYAVSVSRVASNLIVIGVLYRRTSAEWVAVFVLMRSWLGLINNLTAGLAPATLAELSRRTDEERPTLALPIGPTESDRTLHYANPVSTPTDHKPLISRRYSSLYASMAWFALLTPLTIALPKRVSFVETFGTRNFDEAIRQAIFAYAIGVFCRALSENAGAANQWQGRLAVDNAIVAFGEGCFVAMVLSYEASDRAGVLSAIALAYAASGGVIFVARWILAAEWREMFSGAAADVRLASRIFGVALFISLGSFADFLYAPTNTLLIGHYLGSETLAAYAPLLQIDAGLLLLIAAIGPVLLPRVSAAIAAGDVARVRRLYLQSMLVGVGVLACGALAVIVAGRPLLKLWIGEAPPLTLQLLPLVLIHTVVGGSAGIGRATLLGMNQFRAYTISALVGGITNVALAFLFVAGFGWGVRGVVFATILSVVGRCAIWMPWHVLRTLGKPSPAAAVAPI